MFVTARSSHAACQSFFTVRRVPISAADVAKMMEAMGVDRVCCVDLHCGQIQGFFGPRTPVDNLFATPIALGYFQTRELVNCAIVSPDAGGVARAHYVSAAAALGHRALDDGVGALPPVADGAPHLLPSLVEGGHVGRQPKREAILIDLDLLRRGRAQEVDEAAF